MSDARRHSQLVSYPSAARSAWTTSRPRRRSAATFSTKTSPGRRWRTASATDPQRLERAPVMPSRLPASEMSWQGKPAVTMSTGATVVQSTVRMSPRLSTPGKRWVRTVRACRSVSAYQARCPPRTACTARSRPPYPVHSDPIRGGPMRGGPMRGGPTRGGPTRGGPTRGGPMRGGPMRGGPMRGGPMRGDPLPGSGWGWRGGWWPRFTPPPATRGSAAVRPSRGLTDLVGSRR